MALDRQGRRPMRPLRPRRRWASIHCQVATCQVATCSCHKRARPSQVLGAHTRLHFSRRRCQQHGARSTRALLLLLGALRALRMLAAMSGGPSQGILEALLALIRTTRCAYGAMETTRTTNRLGWT